MESSTFFGAGTDRPNLILREGERERKEKKKEVERERTARKAAFRKHSFIRLVE